MISFLALGSHIVLFDFACLFFFFLMTVNSNCFHFKNFTAAHCSHGRSGESKIKNENPCLLSLSYELRPNLGSSLRAEVSIWHLGLLHLGLDHTDGLDCPKGWDWYIPFFPPNSETGMYHGKGLSLHPKGRAEWSGWKGPAMPGGPNSGHV